MKYYLADTENIGNQWLQIGNELKSGDKIILFHTESNANQNLTLAQLSAITRNGEIQISSITCHTGTNALDFQLVSYLGYLIAQHNEQNIEYIIISHDNGYDPLIKFWQDKHINIRKFEPVSTSSGSVNKPTTAPTPPSRPDMSLTEIILPLKQTYIEKLKAAGFTDQTTMEKIANVMLHTVNLPARGQALQIQNQMRQAFRKNGLDLYHQAKPVFDEIIKHGPYPPRKETTTTASA